MTGKIICLAALVLFCLVGPAFADDVIGTVKTIRGDASVVRGAQSAAAQEGGRLYRGDALETGADGAMGVILRDDTTISMGPNAESLDDLCFSPERARCP
jgi:hypothetical protein